MIRSILKNFLPQSVIVKNNVTSRGVRGARKPKLTREDIFASVDEHLSVSQTENRDLDNFQRSFDGWDFEELHPEDVTYHIDRRDSSAKNYQRKLQSRKKQLKYAILRKQNSKGESHPNLLTWKAKEQIKYLMSDGNWTLNKVEECFPATREAIVKIAKDRQTFSRSEKERQDNRVRKKWKLINRQGFLNEDQHRYLIESGKMEILPNAAGLEDIKVPEHFLKKYEICDILDSERAIGPFESLIHGYLETKRDCKLDLIENGETPKTPSLQKDRKFLDYIAKKFLNPESAESQVSGESVDKSDEMARNAMKTEETFNVKQEELKKKRTKSFNVIQRGNAYYDESGEFLYRVP